MKTKKIHTLNIIFLAGAGGVGKTSVAKELKAQATSLGLKAGIVKSTTRDTYARLNIGTEGDAQSLTDEQKLFLQESIMDDYSRNLQDEVTLATVEGLDVLVVDRTPYDHLSYRMVLLPKLTLEYIETVLETLKVFSTELLLPRLLSITTQEYVKIKSSVWFFSYPTSWAKSGAANDGWRYAPGARNYVWSACLDNLLKEYGGHLITTGLQGFFPYDRTPIKERAIKILTRQSLLKR